MDTLTRRDSTNGLLFLKKTQYATVYRITGTNKALKKFVDDDVQIREVLNLKLLKCYPHDNIIKAEIVERNNSICIEMPLYVGDLFNLGRVQKQANILRFVHQISSAIAFLHNTGIIHRDIKPGNILISTLNEDTTNFILTDMGSSRICTLADGARYTDEATTAIYQAPELWLGNNKGKFSQATDAWAFGAVIFELQHGVHLIDPVVFARKREPLLKAISGRDLDIEPDSPRSSSSSNTTKLFDEDDNIALDKISLCRSQSDSTNSRLNQTNNITNYYLVMQRLAQHVQLNTDDNAYLYKYNELRNISGQKPIKIYKSNDLYTSNSFIRLNPSSRRLPTAHKPNELRISSDNIFNAYKDIIPEWNPKNRTIKISEELRATLAWLCDLKYIPLTITEDFIVDQYYYLSAVLNKNTKSKYSQYSIALVSAMLGFMYFQADLNIEMINIFEWDVKHNITEDTFPQLIFDAILYSAPLFRV